MSARRQIIARLSEDSMGGIATLHDVADAEQLVDAHRAEVAAETRRDDADSFERYPWHSDGAPYDNGRDAAIIWVVSTLRRRAEVGEKSGPAGQNGEAYDGELVMLRGLVATLHAVAKHGDLADVQKLLAEHERDEQDAYAEEKKTSPTAKATPFFKPGHTYTRPHHGQPITFFVSAVSTSPDGHTTVAHGWRITPYTNGGWELADADDMDGWTELVEAGETA